MRREHIINKIICGDVSDVLRQLPSDFVDCVVTSPPYWSLRDYGNQTEKIWDEKEGCEHNFEIKKIKNPMDRGGKGQHDSGGIVGKMGDKTLSKAEQGFCSNCSAWRGQLGLEPTFDLYIKHLCDIFDEAKRVLKQEGTCWVNLGDTYSGSHQGYGKNSLNRVLHKKIENLGSVDNYLEKYKHIINQAPPSAKTSVADKSLCLIPFRFAIEMVNRGWILRNVIVWHKPNCMPSSVKDRLTVDFEYIFFFVKDKKYWFETQYDPLKDSSIDRLKHNFNMNKGDIQSAVKTSGIKKFQERFLKNQVQGKNKRCVWSITTRGFKGAHFAVFPPQLVETPIKAGCPEFVCKRCGKAKEPIIESQFKQHSIGATSRQYWKVRDFKGDNTVKNSSLKVGYTDCGCNAGFRPGIVLDPFCGSGTTLAVAKKLSRNYIGIELNPDYVKMSRKRIEGSYGNKDN